MLQIIEALTETCVQLGEKYGPKAALAVLILVGCGVALRILRGVLTAGRAK